MIASVRMGKAKRIAAMGGFALVAAAPFVHAEEPSSVPAPAGGAPVAAPPSAGPLPAASVDAAEQPVRVQYDAIDGCPDAATFFLQVRARTQRVRLAREGELATSVAVRIAQGLGFVRGTLDMPGESGRPFQRTVESPSCREVVVALSLVVALAFDPDALVALPETLPAEPAPAAPPPPAPAPPPPPAPAPESRPTPPDEPPARFGAGADFSLMMGGFAPLGLVVAPFVEVGSGKEAEDGWTPRLRATLLVGLPNDVEAKASGRHAELDLIAGRVDVCPWSVTLIPELSASPCAALEAGRIRGKATEGVPEGFGNQRSELWIAGSLLANVRFHFARSFFLEALGGMGIPLISPDSFQFENPPPSEEIYDVKIAYGQVGVGVGAHFP